MPAGRILIVDDEPDALNLLREVLTRAGYQAQAASNGAEALARASESAPDLLVTDLSMPGMDGVELCRRFRARVETRFVPIIVTSALPRLPIALHGAVEAFFPKPLDLDRLLDAIAFYVPED